MNIQGWFPLGLTGWISLQSKGLSRVFSNTTIQKHQFFSTQPSLWSSSHIAMWPLEKPELCSAALFLVSCVDGLDPTTLQRVTLHGVLVDGSYDMSNPTTKLESKFRVFCSLGFLFHLVLVPYLHLDCQWREGHSQRDKKGFTWFLKSPEAPPQNPAWLVWMLRQKAPFWLIETVSCFLWFYGGFWMSQTQLSN